jgi:hypothetical protein
MLKKQHNAKNSTRHAIACRRVDLMTGLALERTTGPSKVAALR